MMIRADIVIVVIILCVCRVTVLSVFCSYVLTPRPSLRFCEILSSSCCLLCMLGTVIFSRYVLFFVCLVTICPFYLFRVCLLFLLFMQFVNFYVFVCLWSELYISIY